MEAVRRRVSEARQNLQGGESGKVAFVALPRLHKALSGAELSIDLLTAPTQGQGEYRAIVVRNLASDNNWEAGLAPWLACLAKGGLFLSIDRSSHKRAQEVCRKLLCLGISDIHQEIAGRRILTSGRCIAKIDPSSESGYSDTIA